MSKPAPGVSGPGAVPVIAATAIAGADGGLETAAAVGVSLALAGEPDGAGDASVLLAEVGARRARGPTMLASAAARRLESDLRAAGLEAAARGRLAWVRVADDEDWVDRLDAALDAGAGAGAALVYVPGRLWRPLLEAERFDVRAVLLRADLPAHRSLAALAAGELHAAGYRVRVATAAPGRVGGRRAAVGIEPGGEASRRAARLARGLPIARGGPVRPPLVAEAGQALPLVLGSAIALAFCALLLAALGGAVTGKARAQRVVDLAALSGARSMRDDFDRLFAPARLPNGSPNPVHLERAQYLARARLAATEAVRRNGADAARLGVSFPDAQSFAPLRVRAVLRAELATGPARPSPAVVQAEAEATPPVSDPSAGAEMASGGGYAGPLAYRQGKPMRPDVALGFDRLSAAARADGIALTITSAFRSDAEQAALFAQNPDPRWVAPPGRSLHRCATELDLGPPSAYGWLASHAPGFGFLKRYAWEPWHWGFDRGPPPCSAAGDRVGSGSAPAAAGADGAASEAGLPAYVPARFRDAIAAAATRWNVSAGLLAAQLMAESNFNPFAVSPAGAQGIAQFMPATATAYGLRDPFDAAAAIDAQAHLMSDLLREFGSVPLALAAYNAGPAAVEACGCVPRYPETEAYVARILGLMGGAGELVAAPLEVRLTE